MLIAPAGVLPAGLLLHLGGLGGLRPGSRPIRCLHQAGGQCLQFGGEVPASRSTAVTVPPRCQEILQS